MADLTISNSSVGNMLTELLMCDELTPGDEPSYQICKTIYLYHPLGGKIVDGPTKLAQSQPREITVLDAPDTVVEEFAAQWKRDRANETIKNLAGLARIYGVGSLVVGAEGIAPEATLDPKKYHEYDLFFNTVDPLSTAGSIVMNQDPNSPNFQKTTVITVSGTSYHRSRTCVMMNEAPVYIAFTTSAFGYTGRSVYQRPLFPLKTFVQTMITDDAVTTKAALLIAKIQQPGSIVDRLMQGATALKRTLLQGARTGNVLSINSGNTGQNPEEIETLNMQNVEGAAGFARTNCLKNIATGADMPAVMLENETLTEGFGEGTEDAKNIARWIDGYREWLDPAYDFLTPIVQRRAWNPDWYKTLQARFPDQYEGVTYETAFYQLQNNFRAVWPNLLKEPDSEAVKSEKVKLEGLTSILQILLPILDPENKAKAVQFLMDNLNKMPLMFPAPLEIDLDALAEYEPPASGDEDSGSGEREPKAMSLKDSLPPIRRLAVG